VESKELFLMVEAISNEKNISKEDVFEALEEAMAVATKKRHNIDAYVEIDRKTGDFSTFRQWMVIVDGDNFVDDDGTEFDATLHIHAKDANGVEVDDFVREPMKIKIILYFSLFSPKNVPLYLLFQLNQYPIYGYLYLSLTQYCCCFHSRYR
jgi:Fe-S-cluster formation regulator IscX/YfhJ